MKPIRRHLRRAQLHLSRARRSLRTAQRLAIETGSGSTCIAALSVALTQNAEAHQHIDDIAALPGATKPHMTAWRG